jgi:ABC-type antimicrobial peptide transport system permease subunit
MFQLKIILRNIRRGGIYSAINIGGLAIGMAAAILILAWIYHEWSYDRFHAKEKRLHVVYYRAELDGSLQCWDKPHIALGPVLKNDYPDIVGMARMLNAALLYANNESSLKMQTGYTDPDFLTMFDFPLLKGNKQTALNDPYSVILTEKAAMRLFGNNEPLGEMLTFDNQYAMTVTGVMKDLPDNTLFQFDALVPFAFIKVQGWYDLGWVNNSTQTYVELHPNARLDLVNESVCNSMQIWANMTELPEVFLYPLSKRYMYSKFENGIPVGGLIETVRIFFVIAGLIVLIACINFMNLSTARSEKRAKEVGVRKVLGGKRLSLISLFVGESMITAFIAGVIALCFALVALPFFEILLGRQLILNLGSIWFWVSGLGFVFITGMLSGSYPALFLSSFIPVKVLKGIFDKKQASVSLRKVLVVLQFAVASTLIISTFVLHRQIMYVQNREAGFAKDQLIYAFMDGDVGKNYELIKHELLHSGTAISITRTLDPMTQSMNSTSRVNWQGKNPTEIFLFDRFSTDADWTKTVGATIIEGRDIDIYTYPTDSTAVLLNETAVKIMHFENPIGEIVTAHNIDWHVVGVVKDFILHSPYETVSPMLIDGHAGLFKTLHIKLNGNNRMADNIANAAQIFKMYNPAYPFEYNFVDEEYARKFHKEQEMGTLLSGFACLAIFVSCMGLFALVAYMAETRRKEIGIRKVLGASVSGIVLLLSKEFLILVLISVAVASPLAWWAMNKWLANYAYRTDIPWWLFVVVGCISVGIALLTVGFQALKAATANPVEAIKSE